MRTFISLQALIFLCALSFYVSSQSRPFLEGFEPGIILIALDPSYEVEKSELNKNYLNDQTEQATLLDIQMEIASLASDYNKVIFLVSDDQSYTFLSNNQLLTEKFNNGQIETIKVNHDASWVRDYGPFFYIDDSLINVLDATYHDSRQDAYIKSMLFEINNARQELALGYIDKTLETDYIEYLYTETEFELDEFLMIYLLYDLKTLEKWSGKKLLTFDQYKDKFENEFKLEKEEIINSLSIYQALNEVLTEKHSLRFNDDMVPELLPEFIYDVQKFHITKLSNFNMSGGNLLITNNCDCFTTTEIIPENNNNKELVIINLMKNYGCKKVLFLEPLPGEYIIKHVDMFILPIDSKNILLASYSPEHEILANEWVSHASKIKELDNYQEYDDIYSDIDPYDYAVQEKLSIEAEIAMRKNKLILEKNGFNVITIPSYLPRNDMSSNEIAESNEYLFYPTLLNCLVQCSDDKKTIQIIMPRYDELNPEIFQNAQKIIEEQFTKIYGETMKISVKSIECMQSAKEQGAIHCLTLSMPVSYSKYTDYFYINERDKIMNKIHELNR
jgi:agmatine/peptidylarginine deiminase